MQTCPDCGSQMILENEVPICIFCPGRKSVVPKIPPKKFTTHDQKAMSAMFDEPNGKAVVGKAQMVVSGSSVVDALDVMRQLPMPKDIKDFRKIQKIIKLMEGLVGEDNDAN